MCMCFFVNIYNTRTFQNGFKIMLIIFQLHTNKAIPLIFAQIPSYFAKKNQQQQMFKF